MSKGQKRNTNYCLCVGFCMQNDIWQDEPMPHHLKIRIAVSGCEGAPICQGTNKFITKKKPKYNPEN